MTNHNFSFKQILRYSLLFASIFLLIYCLSTCYIMHQRAEFFKEFCRTAELVELKDGRKVYVSPKFIEENKDDIVWRKAGR